MERGEHTADTPAPSPLGEGLPVFVLYAVLAVVITWPVAANLGEALAGSGYDIYSHLWTFDWIKDSLLSLQNPYYTTRIFYPRGVSLADHNIAWLQILLWMPLQALVGLVAAYNLLFLGILAANGLALYGLARELLDSRPAAFVGGLIYAFWPYVLSQNEHPNMIFITWIPLALLYLKRALDRGRRRDALLAGLFLALTGWARWHLLIMGAVVVGLYLLYRLLAERDLWRRQTLLQLLLVAGTSALLLAPIAIPVAARQLTRAHPEDLFLEEQEALQTDLLSYVVPASLHPLWDTPLARLFAPLAAGFDLNTRTLSPFVGYSVLLLALAGTIRYWRRSRFWLLVAAVYLLLALGPVLKFGGHIYEQVTLPYAAVEDFFLFRLLRKPDRFNVLLALPLALLAAFGAQAALSFFGSTRRRLLLAALLSLLILGEYAAFPYPQSDPGVPAWLAARAGDEEAYALLHVPHDLFGADKYYMYYQIVHGKPLVNGKVARTPREALAFWESTPLLRQLAEDEYDDLALASIPDVGHQLRTLAERQIRYLVFHKELLPNGWLPLWREWLTVEPYYEDEELLVFRTGVQAGEDFDFAENLGDGIGLIQASYGPDATVQGGRIIVDATWGSRAAPEQNYLACFQLLGPGGEAAHHACQPVSADWPTGRWQADELVRASYSLPVPRTLAPGSYALSLELRGAGENAPTGSGAVLGAVAVLPFAPETETGYVWQEEIALRGYDLATADGSIDLTLYWEALGQPEGSYKFFVHLIDVEREEVAAQRDFVPRNWQYPTYLWQPEEIVSERLSLSAAEVPPGVYQLWVGFYEEGSGRRLPLTAGEGVAENGAVQLETIDLSQSPDGRE